MRDDIYLDGIKTQFSSINQPKSTGRKKGSKNFNTLLKKYLDKKVELENPITKQIEKKATIEHVILMLITKSVEGDMPAIKELLNRLLGKSTEKIKFDGKLQSSHLSTEDKIRIENNLKEILKSEFNKK